MKFLVSSIKYIIYLSILFLAVDIIVTSTYFTRDARIYNINNVTCKSELAYDYCPSITQIYFPHPLDSFFPTTSFVNSDSVMVSSIKDTLSKSQLDFDYLLLGDSFIQADEIPFNSRVGGILNNRNINVLSKGYSSYNLFQYKHFLSDYGETTSMKGKNVFIFLFINDFMPSYSSSTYNTFIKSASGSHFYSDSYPSPS